MQHAVCCIIRQVGPSNACTSLLRRALKLRSILLDTLEHVFVTLRCQGDHLAGPHAAAARPSALSELIRLAISMAVMAASPPLLPTLPPARSSACVCGGGGHTRVNSQHKGTETTHAREQNKASVIQQLVCCTCGTAATAVQPPCCLPLRGICNGCTMQQVDRHMALDSHSTGAGHAPTKLPATPSPAPWCHMSAHQTQQGRLRSTWHRCRSSCSQCPNWCILHGLKTE
jgi:hypothetical protein